MCRNSIASVSASTTTTTVPNTIQIQSSEYIVKSTNNIIAASNAKSHTITVAPSTSNATQASSTAATLKSLSNGTGIGRGALDSRLKRAPPARTSLLPPPGSKATASVGQQQQQQQHHQTNTSQSATSHIASNMSPLNLLYAGRATPFTNGYVKCYKDYSVVVTNNDASTAYGPICKIICKTTKERNKQLWEKFIGGNVVNVSICARYVLVATNDGSLHFLNINTGIAILPIMKLITPAIQSAFVSICV